MLELAEEEPEIDPPPVLAPDMLEPLTDPPLLPPMLGSSHADPPKLSCLCGGTLLSEIIEAPAHANIDPPAPIFEPAELAPETLEPADESPPEMFVPGLDLPLVPFDLHQQRHITVPLFALGVPPVALFPPDMTEADLQLL